MSIRFSLSPAKKPSVRPSGDQNGKLAPSVPATERAEEESSERTQIVVVPSIEAGNATDLPSGEIAVQLPSSAFSGGRIVKTERSTGGALRTFDSANPAARPMSTSAEAARSRMSADGRRESATRRASGIAAALVSEAQRSSLATSAADCHRSSGSFARHLRSTWSSAAGASG